METIQLSDGRCGGAFFFLFFSFLPFNVSLYTTVSYANLFYFILFYSNTNAILRLNKRLVKRTNGWWSK